MSAPTAAQTSVKRERPTAAVRRTAAASAVAMPRVTVVLGRAIVAAFRCANCHQDEPVDAGIILSGRVTLAGDSGLHPKNLTPDPATGLGCWTDDQIMNAFMNGIDEQGRDALRAHAAIRRASRRRHRAASRRLSPLDPGRPQGGPRNHELSAGAAAAGAATRRWHRRGRRWSAHRRRDLTARRMVAPMVRHRLTRDLIPHPTPDPTLRRRTAAPTRPHPTARRPTRDPTPRFPTSKSMSSPIRTTALRSTSISTAATNSTASVLRHTRSRSAISALRPAARHLALPASLRADALRFASWASDGLRPLRHCLFGQALEWPYGDFDDRSGSENLTQ